MCKQGKLLAMPVHLSVSQPVSQKLIQQFRQQRLLYVAYSSMWGNFSMHSCLSSGIRTSIVHLNKICFNHCLYDNLGCYIGGQIYFLSPTGSYVWALHFTCMTRKEMKQCRLWCHYLLLDCPHANTAKSAFGYETVSETVHVSLRKSRYTL